MGWRVACKGRGEMYIGFCREILRERKKKKKPDIDGGDKIKMNLQEVGWGAMDWIDLFEDRDMWRALVYAILNLRVSSIAGNFLDWLKIG
jgi:hypothetical protein